MTNHRARTGALVVMFVSCMSGCAVVAVTDAVVSVAATAVSVGSNVVGAGVDVARAGVRVLTNNDDRKK